MCDLKTHQGACHCGAVKFEIDAPSQLHAHACNCSICYMSGGDQMIVPASRFRLLSGESAISTYTFNTGAAQHTFCKHCGIKAFYTPRSLTQMDLASICAALIAALLTLLRWISLMAKTGNRMRHPWPICPVMTNSRVN